MGLLGQQQQAYLADRIFEVFDSDKDGYIDIQAFISIMDVLCNGTEDEKHMFSFALMDQNYNGEISFDEFYDYFFKVISHWSSLINSHVRINRQFMYDIFSQISHKDPMSISFDEYRKALHKNPELLDWFEILNSTYNVEDRSKSDATKAQKA
jgi:Ca2+-binding EF-hand superfamily protein